MSHANHNTSVSALLGTVIQDASGRMTGHVGEFAVSPTVDASHIYAILLRASKPAMIPLDNLEMVSTGALQMRAGVSPEPIPHDDAYLLLDRDVLDQQIIDVHGHKVVRVNDVDLVWETAAHGSNGESDADAVQGATPGLGLALRIAQVEVGTRGAVRRLLKGLPVSTVSGLANKFKSTVIPWEFVDLIDRDPARRVRLKIEQDRLAKMHPADIASILEELAPAERQALFTSLDEEVAAEALEEVEPRMQMALTESLDSERMAGIVEEMDPAAAADFLAELSDERSEAILEEMGPEERQDVEELLEFTGNSAAAQMTTDYISLRENAKVGEAVTALHEFAGDIETLTHIFLLDEDEKLHGVVSLVKLLLAASEVELATLTDGHVVSCDVNTSEKKVAELFDKYNLRALPVVDDEKKLAGVIYPEQVIAQLREHT
jgi:magnesium transporter